MLSDGVRLIVVVAVADAVTVPPAGVRAFTVAVLTTWPALTSASVSVRVASMMPPACLALDAGRVDPSKVSPTDLPQPPAIDNAAGARQDAEMGECKTDAGSQEVTGKVTNSGGEPIDYVVVVNWVNPTSDVMGRGIAVLKAVEPGAAVDWSVTAEVADGADSCTLNVQKGTVTE